ncbi:MAG: S8 family serine peptidase [Chloroflexia bacterium]
MTTRRPAWGWQFTSEALQQLAPLQPLEAINSEWAWRNSTGQGVKVGVIDSGIDADHPAVAGPVNGYVAISERAGNITYNEEPHEDLYGHGTACAAIIRSLAPECELYSVRVLGAGLIGRGAVFAAGLRWCVENGIHVCNLSLGTTKKDFYALFHEIADQAYFQNTILVTAANNMPVPSFPSVYSSVISVASHDTPDPYLYYYNPSPPVEFGAFGIDVRLAWLNRGYITATGNSFAAPHMTGIVTRILGKHPGLTLFQLKTILRATSANVAPQAEFAAGPIEATASEKLDVIS